MWGVLGLWAILLTKAMAVGLLLLLSNVVFNTQRNTTNNKNLRALRPSIYVCVYACKCTGGLARDTPIAPSHPHGSFCSRFAVSALSLSQCLFLVLTMSCLCMLWSSLVFFCFVCHEWMSPIQCPLPMDGGRGSMHVGACECVDVLCVSVQTRTWTGP